MAPTSRVPGFGSRLGIGSAGASSAGQGFDRARANLTHAVLASLLLVRALAFGIWGGCRTVIRMSEVFK